MINMSRRGNAIIGALTLIPMLGFASLSVDIGLQRVVNTQLQVMADAATVSGVYMLDGTGQGVNNALNEVVQVASQNTTYFGYQPRIEEIKFGKYEQGVFHELPSYEFEEINAIQMNPVHTHPSRLAGTAYGIFELNSEASATAVRPTGGTAKNVNCYLPFAVPVCHFEDLGEGENPPPLELNLMNLNTVGWSNPDGNPNTNSIISQLSDQCASGVASVYTDEDGDTQENNIYISNGQNNAAASYIANVINDKTSTEPDEWPYDIFGSRYLRDGVHANLASESEISAMNWGNNISGVMPIIEHKCGKNFVGTARIIGWTYAYIYDTKTKGKGEKNVWMQFDLVSEYDLGTGHVDDGTGNVVGTTPPVLVR